MRLLILLSGIFFLVNAIVFLLPTDAETTNLKYESSPEMNESEIQFLAKESSMIDTLSIDVDIQPELPMQVKVDPQLEVSVRPEVSRSEVSKPEAKIEVPKTVEPDAALSSASVSEKSALDAVSVKVTPAVAQCYRIGPFLREARMRASGKQLVDIEYRVIKREATEVFATRVYVGPFDSLSRALQSRKNLTAAGINDHFHRRDPDGTYIVSLGIYSKNASAIRQRSKFQSLGLPAQTRDEKTRLPKNYWLELPGDITQKDIASLSKISWGESSVSLGRHSCQP